MVRHLSTNLMHSDTDYLTGTIYFMYVIRYQSFDKETSIEK